MKIFKYPVQIADTFELLLPEGAEVLSVDAQNDGPQMWAKIDNQARVTLRRFHVRGTAHAFTGEEGRYVGTFQTAGGAFVWHLFESICDLQSRNERLEMVYEVAASQGVPDEYRVEGIDYAREGSVYVTIFSGPDAEQRAREYAHFKNSQTLKG